MTIQEKRDKTIIERYGSLEAFKEQRYRNPEKAETRKRVASIAGKAAKKRNYDDPIKASEAGKKSWENRRGQTKD